jgi:membrane-associated phospholipid phosphatase
MRPLLAAVTVVAALALPGVAGADVVTSWNRTLVDVLEATHTPPPPAARDAAIVSSSVFDAVNGVARQFAPVHVVPDAPHGASRAAAAVAAAHESLVALFPSRQAMLDGRYADSLAELGSSPSVQRGLAWGTQAADEILAWRSNDGFTAVLAPYLGSTLPGRWQPTPPAFGPPLFRQFAQMTPFALASPGQFPLPGPPALTSALYATDLNEVEALGSAASSLRTDTETETARFWQLDTPAAMWDRVADALAEAQPWSLVREARVLALTNIALADTTIAVWNAKNVFDSWRPITAIVDAGSDGNPATIPDPSWTPLLPTPQFQEYPSAHSAVSASAAAVLASFYGEDTHFTVTSVGLPGVERSFSSFPAAVAQIVDARIFAGFHFRFACEDGVTLGNEISTYIRATTLLRAAGGAR